MLSVAEMAAALEPAIRRLIRAELRAVGLRPLPPRGPGAWRWDDEADAWRDVLDAPASPPASPSA